MKILNVHIENFLGIGIAHVKLDRKGITLVEGENNDSKTALSNGAGKSTLFEAVYWSLFGQTRRGSKSDEVVNRHTKGGCLVRVIVEVAGKHAAITRTRKYGSASESTLKIEHDGDDLTRGVTRDSQVLLEELIGMGPMTFSKAVFFGQGDQKPFASLTDSELKMVFEQALGLTWFSESKAKVAGYLSSLKQIVSQSEISMSLMVGEKTLAQNKVDSMIALIARDEEEKKTWRKGMDDRVAQLDEYKIKLVEVIAGLTAKHTESTTLNVGLSAKIVELKALNEKLGDAIAEKNTSLARNQTLAISTNNTIKALSKRSEELVSLVGCACQSCTQPVTEAVVGHAKEALQNDIAAETTILQNHKENYAASQAERTKLDALLNQLAAKIKLTEDEIKNHNNIISECKGKFEGYHLQLGNNNVERTNITSLVAKGSTKDIEIEANKKTLDLLNSNLDVAADRIAQEEKKAVEHKLKIEKVSTLNDALGNAGVKSYVFDSITPELNTWSNRYLQILEPDLSVEISTVTKLKTGDFREKFSIGVANVNGANSLSGSSGGEQQKVNLAVALAFNKLMRSMAGGDVPMLVLDEPFEALDEGSSDQVIELLESLDSDNLYLITHNKSVRDLVPNRMLVSKTKGISTVSEVA